ncbi:hypothetical protein PDE_04387 [Penicillium oxalicum 114-2]|uniref:Uncharacterized protein n=1 Tax=Penicillium oxalicum (strain 114-2 / CGMCC 5302) TaxID=933388 RepID=S8ATJ9_PENO1|nr:hypothetical protein PDE_04387 [Penicillium oxalicum 114-2]
MAKVIFTPWKNRAHLLEVRDEFYPPPSYCGPDMRSQACAKVAAWKLRGNIPHHVEATALLTDAILHDDGQRNSIFSIRATYSAAFCRFVTGLVDTKVTGPRKTMFQRAMDLSLPASFVELRHEATHREPPSLTVLRKATQRSLEWLWDNYWATLDPAGLGGAPLRAYHSGAPTSVAIRQVLQAFMKDSNLRSAQKKRKRGQEAAVAEQLLEICCSSADGVVLAIADIPVLLLEMGALIEPQRRLGDPLDAIFEKWDPVLQRVADTQPLFPQFLTEELVNALVLSASPESVESAQSEALCLWLEHIFVSSTWESHRQTLPGKYLTAVCESDKFYWTQLLASKLRSVQQTSLPERRGRNGAKASSPSNHTGNDPVDSLPEILQRHGWSLANHCDNRSLGVAVAK